MPEEIKADLESLDNIRKKLSVTVPAEEVDREFSRAYRDAQKKAVLPGFRKGHVPMPRIRQLYGKEIGDDVARELMSRAFQQARRQLGFINVSDPSVDDFRIVEGQPLNFTAMFEARPEIRIEGYKGLALTRKADPVTDEDVQKVLEDLRRKVAHVRDLTAERGIERGDIAVIDFEGFVDGAPIPGGKGEGFPLEIGSGSFIPGFEESLTGLRPGEEKKFILAMPADYRQAELAGREAQFSVTVKGIKERVLPALDDEFARDVGDYAGLDELKVKVRENMAQVREREARSGLKQQAIDALEAKVEFDLPPSLVESEVATIMRDYVRRLAMRGMSPEEARSQVEATQEEARKAAARNVKITLMLDEIARREGIKVERGDLDKALQELAERYKKPVAELRREMIKSGSIESFAQVILEEKVLEFLVDSGVVGTEKK